MFTKGTSGNKNGRPVNSKNKVSQEIREKFKLLIDGNFEQIENDFTHQGTNTSTSVYSEP